MKHITVSFRIINPFEDTDGSKVYPRSQINVFRSRIKEFVKL